MKSLKKTLVLLVVLSMILSAVSPVFAFNDVIDEDYAEQANKMAAFGVFTGDANGNFNAEENITRAEMAVVIGRLMGLTTNEANANQYYASNFSDVAAGEWYTGWVNLVAGRGIISGFPDGTFRPNEKVTQAQAVTMIVKALGWGVVVDQTGTWPANYITKASELRLFKDAVDTNSELVTRGNVAIYCYNALTAKTWDVVESTDGSLTSSSKGETILAKYFSDFVNKDGDMKLVENAKVTATPVNDNTIGSNQIVLTEDGETEYEAASSTETLATFLDAEKAGKNKEEKTYKKSANDIVAYIPEEVCNNIATLNGKYVDVIFGKNNIVAYIAVTDDAQSGLLVTAWDKSKGEIELDGTTYEVNTNAEVVLFGTYVIPTSTTYNAIRAIDDIFVKNLKMSNLNKRFDRTVEANIVLNEDEEITRIDFVASEDFGSGSVALTLNKKSVNVGLQEAIVKKISNGRVYTIGGNSVINAAKLEDLEDADVRVIKNNEIVSVDDIDVGNVLTLVLEVDTTKTIKTIYVSDEIVTGEVEKVKNTTITVDGTVYNTVNAIIGDLNGEIEDAKGSVDVTEYYEEDVTLYLNFLGEVSAIVAESEATSATVGMIVSTPSPKVDDDDIDYFRIKILTSDNVKKSYKVYMDDEDDEFPTEFKNLHEGDLVVFSADADKVITLDEDETKKEEMGIALVKKDDKFKADGADLEVIDLSGYTADYDKQTVKVGEKTYRFNSSSILYNKHSDKLEIASRWASVCDKDNNAVFSSNDLVVLDGTRVKYCLFNTDTYKSEEAKYAVLVDIDYTRNEDDDKVYIATLYLDDEEVKYELNKGVSRKDLTEGDFVNYTVSDDEITAMSTVVSVFDIKGKDVDADISGLISGAQDLPTSDVIKARFEVDEVDDGYIYYVDDVAKDGTNNYDAVKELVVDEDGYVIYDLRDNSWEMFEGKLEDIEGLYVVGFCTDSSSANTDVDILVIFE